MANSMSSPLNQITKLAREYGAMTYIDDCHGEGVLAGGRGIGAHFGVEDEVDMESGSFSKAFGVVGGLIAGEKHMVDYAFNKSRTMLLSGSAPPATIAACNASIEVLETEPEHVEKLWSNTEYFRKEVQSMGFDTGVSETPIIPVMCGESHKAKELSAKLLELDVFALPIVFPMVAPDKARIRVMMSAGLEKEDLLNLGISSLLHDLGKSKIDSTIINKNGLLTDVEFVEVKNHPYYGWLIAQEIGISNKDILDGIVYHHEKIDGTGYPKGLKGDKIPLYAKIISICDAFDAISTKRTYKDSISSFGALLLMKKEMSNSFDIHLVNSFIQMLRG